MFMFFFLWKNFFFPQLISIYIPKNKQHQTEKKLSKKRATYKLFAQAFVPLGHNINQTIYSLVMILSIK